MKCFYAGHAFKLTCKAASAAHKGAPDFVNASPNHKRRNSLIFDMHYVMAHESDEVKKETQALMGSDASRVGRVCEFMRFAANAENIRT